MKKPKVNSCPDGSDLGAKQVSSPHYRDETTERGAMERREARRHAEAEAHRINLTNLMFKFIRCEIPFKCSALVP
jgi:hypothetical protein